jgi:hypothetical protein
MKELEELRKRYRDRDGNELLGIGLDSYIHPEKLAAIAHKYNYIMHSSFLIDDEGLIREVRDNLENNQEVIVAAWTGDEEHVDLYLKREDPDIPSNRETSSSTAPQEFVDGPVIGQPGKIWGDFSESLLKPEQMAGVYEIVTAEGNGALGCVKCRAVTRLKSCSNCGNVGFSLRGSSIFCVSCEERFRSWSCNSCSCKNPINKLTLLMPKNAKRGCFIATAAYGDRNAPEVIYLSTFRDNCLDQNVVGKRLIKTYYALSPPLAALISTSKLLQIAVRVIMLKPIVFLLRQFEKQ